MPTPDLTPPQLERALFVARHRLQIRGLIILLLILVIGLSLLRTASFYFRLISQTGQLKTLVTSIISDQPAWADVQAATAPQEIKLGAAQVLALGDNHYDFLVEASNPNDNWAVEQLTYEFVKGGEVVASGQTFLLPRERRFLTALDQPSQLPITGVDSVRLVNLACHQLGRPLLDIWQFTDKPSYKARRIISEGAKTYAVPASVSWGVINNFTQTVRQSVWQLVLYSGNRPVTVINFEDGDVNFLEQKNFEVSIFGNIGLIDKVDVLPVVNWFDTSRFYLPQVVPGVTR